MFLGLNRPCRGIVNAHSSEPKRRGGAALQLDPHVETADSERGCRRGSRQHCAQQDRGKDAASWLLGG